MTYNGVLFLLLPWHALVARRRLLRCAIELLNALQPQLGCFDSHQSIV